MINVVLSTSKRPDFLTLSIPLPSVIRRRRGSGDAIEKVGAMYGLRWLWVNVRLLARVSYLPTPLLLFTSLPSQVPNLRCLSGSSNHTYLISHTSSFSQILWNCNLPLSCRQRRALPELRKRLKGSFYKMSELCPWPMQDLEELLTRFHDRPVSSSNPRQAETSAGRYP